MELVKMKQQIIIILILLMAIIGQSSAVMYNTVIAERIQATDQAIIQDVYADNIKGPGGSLTVMEQITRSEFDRILSRLNSKPNFNGPLLVDRVVYANTVYTPALNTPYLKYVELHQTQVEPEPIPNKGFVSSDSDNNLCTLGMRAGSEQARVDLNLSDVNLLDRDGLDDCDVYLHCYAMGYVKTLDLME